ncbi:MAG: SsrA-binding protein SmpB [Candidatus Omnitrophota bacterium]
MKPKKEYTPVISNRQALRDYTIEKTFEAGIQLKGSEIKSLRAALGNLKGSFVKVEGEEIFLYGLHITPYKFSRDETETLRIRKLLLHKREIKYLAVKSLEKGYAIIPLKIYFSRGYAKVEIAIAKGKKLYDKRAAIKEKQAQREISRELRNKNR